MYVMVNLVICVDGSYFFLGSDVEKKKEFEVAGGSQSSKTSFVNGVSVRAMLGPVVKQQQRLRAEDS
jgi:hypothetical protein